MKRYSLLIQLVIYVFIMILALLGIVGGIYYQTSSVAIRQTTEQNTRKTIQQSLSLLIYKRLNRQRVVWLKMRK